MAGGFDRFLDQWASAGTIIPPSDAQCDAGFAYLGPTPPSVEMFNAIFQWNDDKDNWLFNQISHVFAPAPPSETDLDQLLNAIRDLINSAIAGTSGLYLPITGGALAGPGDLIVGGNLNVTGNATMAASITSPYGNIVNLDAAGVVASVSVTAPTVYVGTGSAFHTVGGTPTWMLTADNWRVNWINGELIYWNPGGTKLFSVDQSGAAFCAATFLAGTSITALGALFSNTGQLALNNTGTSTGWIYFGVAAVGSSQIDGASDRMTIKTSNGGSITVVSGSFQSVFVGYQPGGGQWGDLSDERIKQDIKPYDVGLEAILKIKPKTFRYIEETGYDTSVTHVGPIAQEMQQAMPETVHNFPNKLYFPAQEGGESETGLTEYDATNLLAINATAVQWAMVNAFRELNDRVTILEGTEVRGRR